MHGPRLTTTSTLKLFLKLLLMKHELFKQFEGRRVLLTGHTGFKGSWLALWLDALGAEVVGFASIPYPAQPL